MNKVLKYLKPYWFMVFMALALMMLEVMGDLLQPTLMASIVDKGIKSGNIHYVLVTGVIMIGIAIASISGGIGRTIFASKASQFFSADLRAVLFRKIESLSFEGLDKFGTAPLITRLTNDVVQVQGFVLGMMRIMVRAPLLTIGGIVMALLLNPALASVLFITVPLLSIALAIVISKGFPLFSVVQKSLDSVNTVTRENLAGVRVIKAFVRAEYEEKRFKKANDFLTEITMKASRILGLNMPIIFLLMNFSIIAIVWFGGVKVNNGTMQVGHVMAFFTYMTQILFSLTMVASTILIISRAKASADRIAQVLDAESEFDPGIFGEIVIANADAVVGHSKSPDGSRVEFRDVTFRYTSAEGPPMLDSVSFTALPGQTIGILGSTGSGKTTLVSLISRFYEPQEGTILVDGAEVSELPLDTLRGRVGMVLQESVLFTGTIRENIGWGKEGATDDEIIAAAKSAQAHDFIMRFPEKYDTLLGQRGVNLSGGQKQRVCIARALLKHPSLLILDDSTSAVDMGTEARIQKELKKLSGITTIIIAQRVSSVLDADSIIVMEDGCIVGQGNHEELIKANAIYRDIYYSQVGAEGA